LQSFPTHQRLPFGKTGLKLPPIVFGATSLGNLFRAIDPQEKSRIVEQWVANVAPPIVIDSAGKYGAGMSLEVIGRELDRIGIPKSNVVISNKLAWRRTPLITAEPTFEPGAWFGLEHDAVQDISHDGILRCFEEGNAFLSPYAADLVSVHDPDEYLAAATDDSDLKKRTTDIVGAYRALERLRDDGKVAAVGIGAKNWQSIQWLSNYCRFDWVMFANSYTIYSHPIELLEFMNRLSNDGVGIINSALLHGGFLVGGDFFDYRKIDAVVPSDAAKIEWRNQFWSICREFDISPMDAACAFGRQPKAVNTVAISSSRADRVASHVQSVALTIPEPFWTALRNERLINNLP